MTVNNDIITIPQNYLRNMSYNSVRSVLPRQMNPYKTKIYKFPIKLIYFLFRKNSTGIHRKSRFFLVENYLNLCKKCTIFYTIYNVDMDDYLGILLLFYYLLLIKKIIKKL